MPSIVAVLRTGTGRENWASERSVPDQAQPCKSRGGAGILGLSLICDLQSHCCRCCMEETRRLQLTLLQLWDTGDTLQTHILSFPVPAVPSTSGAHTFLKRFKKKQPKFQKENKRWSSWITLKQCLARSFHPWVLPVSPWINLCSAFRVFTPLRPWKLCGASPEDALPPSVPVN